MGPPANAIQTPGLPPPGALGENLIDSSRGASYAHISFPNLDRLRYSD